MNSKFNKTRKIAMQAVSVNIDVRPFDIPTLVCTDHTEKTSSSDYLLAIARAVAENLDIEEFLSKPERIDELRRRLWELDPGF